MNDLSNTVWEKLWINLYNQTQNPDNLFRFMINKVPSNHIEVFLTRAYNKEKNL